MKIKYIQCMSNRNTTYKNISESSVWIDGEQYDFPGSLILFPGISTQTGGAIIDARRDGGELYITVLRRYAGDVPPECDGEYHEVTK